MTTPFYCLARDAASITLQQTRKSAERMKIVHRQRAGPPTRGGLALTLKTIAAAEGAGMGFKLPPLSSVRVFEAAARHGSFKNAAEELNITASAVSHAVQNLEDWLGVELFRRGGGKLELTEPGAAYAAAVGRAIKAIADATGRLPGRRARGRLALSSAPGFAGRWLVPRFSRFMERDADISVDVQTSI